MTLSNLIDDVLLEARNNHIAESEHLSRHQIELWIKSYRAQLIKQDIDKGRTINPLYTTTIKTEVQQVVENNGHCIYVGSTQLPTLIDFNQKPGVISVKDAYGNLIQIGSETKMKLQQYRKYSCNDYIAYVKDNKIYIEGGPNVVEFIEVQVIAEDPTELGECYNPNTDEYPIPASMWGTIKQMIFTKDFQTMRQMVSDAANNSMDDTQNTVNSNVNRSIRR